MGRSNEGAEFVRKYREFNGQRELRPGEDYFPENDKIIDIKKHLKEPPIIHRPRPRKKQKKFKGKIAIVGVIAAAIAGIAGYAIGKTNSDKPITASQKISVLGETPETMGISNEMYYQLESIKSKLDNEDISNTDLINLAPQIRSLCFDITKSKLSNALGVNTNNISLDIESGDEGTTRQVVKVRKGINEQKYHNETFGLSKNTFSNEIANEIKDIKKSEIIIGKIQNSNFDRNETKSSYNDILENLEEFSAMDITVDERGNIKTSVIKNSELSKVAQEREYTQQTKSRESKDSYTIKNGEIQNVNLEYDDGR